MDVSPCRFLEEEEGAVAQHVAEEEAGLHEHEQGGACTARQQEEGAVQHHAREHDGPRDAVGDEAVELGRVPAVSDVEVEVVRDDGGLRGVGAKKRVGVSASLAIAALAQAPTERLLRARTRGAHSRCSRC